MSTSTGRYRALFENFADPILIIENDTFVECNQAAVDMLGYQDKGALLQCHPSEISPKYQADGRCSFKKANAILARAGDHPYQRFEWDHIKADGTIFPVEVSLTAIPAKGGFTMHTTWRDISERKRLEKELRHSQKMEAIGKLASGIAHDFNNQLVPVLGYSELLANALQDKPELREWALEIHRATSFASILVKKLLAFSRKDDDQPVILNLNDAVNDILGILDKLIGDDIAVDFQPAGIPLCIKVGAGDIEQIVLNLASNSRDALPAGGELKIALSSVITPPMAEQRSGSIINTASIAGTHGGYGPHVYSGCKAAVVQITKTVALEVGAKGIRVNAICPGAIATSIFGRMMGLPSEAADRSAKLMENAFQTLQPIKRSGLPADIAKTALFLASDDSTFVSGQAIAVDGGLTTGRERDPEALANSPLAKALGEAFREASGAD